ncbi:stage II sporulation E family protein [Candidatus Omnitrophus magneticus]|uniref:Stage II sporulation E family protein n=1 Tax=Candidatus Omnitrophus magneticus TaxID=1609969 RepID=A0A0F0CUZ0_9BACT|nr:stage II sporulation E family protein [Candidatus Omnitrophus magneticus]
MLFAGTLNNFLIYRYSLISQFSQLRNELMIIAQTATIKIDVEDLIKIPLVPEAINTPEYKKIEKTLIEIRDISSEFSYVYLMTKTGKENIFKFIVDPENKFKSDITRHALPGEEYDAKEFPEMKNAIYGPSADRKLGMDKWGRFLSGYAPILDKNKNPIAILGIDIRANDVYNMQRSIRYRAILVLLLGTALSITLAMMISNRVTRPIEKLVEGTRQIARGNLDYRVEIKGDDEIAELGNSFTKMSSDLKVYIDELQKATAEKERILKELDIAKDIQQSFLPATPPGIKRFDIYAANFPAREVGGDFYDFIPLENEEWALVIADVSGKGMPAALFMALSRTSIRANARIPKNSITEVIKQANILLLEESRTNMFITLFYAILNPVTFSLKYINAGHNPPLLMNTETGETSLLKAKGIPLGLFYDIEIPEGEITLKKNDILVLYTDGVTETLNKKGEELGVKGLFNMILKYKTLTSKEILENIHNDIHAFSGTTANSDDLTMMVIKVF